MHNGPASLLPTLAEPDCAFHRMRGWMLEEDKLLLELGHQHGLSWRGVVSQIKGGELHRL